jgi:hypothetical protein
MTSVHQVERPIGCNSGSATIDWEIRSLDKGGIPSKEIAMCMNTSLEKSSLNHIAEDVVGVAEWETGNWGYGEQKKQDRL